MKHISKKRTKQRFIISILIMLVCIFGSIIAEIKYYNVIDIGLYSYIVCFKTLKHAIFPCGIVVGAIIDLIYIVSRKIEDLFN